MTRTPSLRPRLLGLLALCLLAGCLTTARRMPPVQELVKVHPDADPDQLQIGRTLVVTECTACHRMYWPGEYGPRAWERISRNMGRRASLGPDQSEAVAVYMSLSAHAVTQSPSEAAGSPRDDQPEDADSPPGDQPEDADSPR